MFPLFASTYTSAAHNTTDSCSESVSHLHVLVVRNNSTPTMLVSLSKQLSSYIVKTKWQLRVQVSIYIPVLIYVLVLYGMPVFYGIPVSRYKIFSLIWIPV